MSFKIGFTAEPETKGLYAQTNHTHTFDGAFRAKRSVVDVHFPQRHITCAYYNDQFDLKRGDVVFVEGKLEGLRGRVIEVNYNFKIKLSGYKRVIAVADTEVIGEFHLAGSHLLTIDGGALTYRQIRTWFFPPEKEDEDYVAANEGDTFALNDLGAMKISNEAAERGHEYYMQNQVAYIELDHGRGRAIVLGSRPYEVEFGFKNGQISGLVCDCYCVGACKHQFATMLQLKEALEIAAEHYHFVDPEDYLAVVSKAVFFENAVDSKPKGTITMR